MQKIVFVVCIFLLMLGCTNTKPNDGFDATINFTIDLKKMQRDGLVGEKPDGYIGIVPSSVSPIIKTAVQNINQQRLKNYQAIAEQNKEAFTAIQALGAKESTLQIAEKVNGAALIEALEPGMYFQDASGNWIKK